MTSAPDRVGPGYRQNVSSAVPDDPPMRELPPHASPLVVSRRDGKVAVHLDLAQVALRICAPRTPKLPGFGSCQVFGSGRSTRTPAVQQKSPRRSGGYCRRCPWGGGLWHRQWQTYAVAQLSAFTIVTVPELSPLSLARPGVCSNWPENAAIVARTGWAAGTLPPFRGGHAAGRADRAARRWVMPSAR